MKNALLIFLSTGLLLNVSAQNNYTWEYDKSTETYTFFEGRKPVVNNIDCFTPYALQGHSNYLFESSLPQGQLAENSPCEYPKMSTDEFNFKHFYSCFGCFLNIRPPKEKFLQEKFYLFAKREGIGFFYTKNGYQSAVLYDQISIVVVDGRRYVVANTKPGINKAPGFYQIKSDIIDLEEGVVKFSADGETSVYMGPDKQPVYWVETSDKKLLLNIKTEIVREFDPEVSIKTGLCDCPASIVLGFEIPDRKVLSTTYMTFAGNSVTIPGRILDPIYDCSTKGYAFNILGYRKFGLYSSDGLEIFKPESEGLIESSALGKYKLIINGRVVYKDKVN